MNILRSLKLKHAKYKLERAKYKLERAMAMVHKLGGGKLVVCEIVRRGKTDYIRKSDGSLCVIGSRNK